MTANSSGSGALREAFTAKRRRLGFLLRQVEHESGIAFSTLARFERGERTGIRTTAGIRIWTDGPDPTSADKLRTMNDAILHALLQMKLGSKPTQDLAERYDRSGEHFYAVEIPVNGGWMTISTVQLARAALALSTPSEAKPDQADIERVAEALDNLMAAAKATLMRGGEPGAHWARLDDAHAAAREIRHTIELRAGCTCQAYPTHCANDCPVHGLSEPTFTAGERVDVPPATLSPSSDAVVGVDR